MYLRWYTDACRAHAQIHVCKCKRMHAYCHEDALVRICMQSEIAFLTVSPGLMSSALLDGVSGVRIF